VSRAYVRKAIPSDIPAVAADMRPADRAELQASGRDNAEQSLLIGLLHGSPCMTICREDDTPVGMYGVVPAAERMGTVWLLGTEGLVSDARVRLRFLREAKAHVARFFDDYDLLWNCVDARNEVHIRWIQWMGFTFIAEHPNYGPEGRRFLEFCKVKPCAPH
jgi:hypothetical protein